MSEIKNNTGIRVVVLSILLFFFTVPHALEDFSLGEPAKNGIPVPALALVISILFALQGFALFLTGKNDRRSYFIHAGVGIFWALASGFAQLPIIVTSDHYRSGIISIIYVAGMITIGVLLSLVSFQSLRKASER